MSKFVHIEKPTVLKTKPYQSTDKRLTDDDKFLVYQPMVLQVGSSVKEGVHWKFSLAGGQSLNGKNTWYVWEGHGAIEDSASSAPGRTPSPKGKGSLIDRVVACYRERDYPLFTKPGEKNLVGIEGMNKDGTYNNDAPNVFNDLIGVFHFNSDGSAEWDCLYTATTEPGRYYTVVRPNSQGAARLALGPHRSWIIGLHKNQYEALCQWGGNVKVYRDKNKDYSREGDRATVGGYGINIHHGGNAPVNDIGRYSAGCQVVRSIQEFQNFMRIVKADPRRKQKGFVYTYTLLWSRWV